MDLTDLPGFKAEQKFHDVGRICLTFVLRQDGIFQHDVLEKLKENGHTIASDAFNKFITGKSKKARWLEGTWETIKALYPTHLRNAFEAYEDPTLRKSALARELDKFINPEPDYNRTDKKTLKRLEGDWTVYRRYFKRPNTECMILALKCRVDDDPRKFSLTTVFNTNNKTRTDIAEGQIIIHGEALTFFGRMAKRQAISIMSVDGSAADDKKAPFEVLSGSMMVQSKSGMPFCTPIVMYRNEPGEVTEPGTLLISDMKQDRKYDDILQVMDQGFVHWAPKI